MSNFIKWFDEKEIEMYLTAGAVAVLVWGILTVIRRLIWQRLETRAKSAEFPWAEELVRRTRAPIRVINVVISATIAAQFAPTRLQQSVALTHGLKLATVLCVFWILDRCAIVVIRRGRIAGQLSQATRSFLVAGIRVVCFVLAGLVVLDTLGISITPLLASLGVGSIAVALALQDTLSNLFSGFYMILDRPVRPGDYVRLEPGVEGIVRQIGWRSTRIEADNNTVVIPNSKLCNATLTNFDQPGSQTAVAVGIGVAYGSDLAEVERVVIDVGREVLARVPGGVKDYQPIVRFNSFGDSALLLTASLRAERFADVAIVRHEFIKALHSRLAKERIVIPFPQRVVHLSPADEKR